MISCFIDSCGLSRRNKSIFPSGFIIAPYTSLSREEPACFSKGLGKVPQRTKGRAGLSLRTNGSRVTDCPPWSWYSFYLWICVDGRVLLGTQEGKEEEAVATSQGEFPPICHGQGQVRHDLSGDEGRGGEPEALTQHAVCTGRVQGRVSTIFSPAGMPPQPPFYRGTWGGSERVHDLPTVTQRPKMAKR